MSPLLLTGSAHPKLAKDMAHSVGTKLGKTQISRFPDGELVIRVDEEMAHRSVFIIQPLSPPVHKHLMEVLLFLDIAQRCQAKRITAVLPYYSYARNAHAPPYGEPYAPAVQAKLLQAAGAQQIVTLDVHTPDLAAWFGIPVQHLHATSLFVSDIRSRLASCDLHPRDVVMVSPDAGGTGRAQTYAEQLGTEVAVVRKHRLGPQAVEAVDVEGAVAGKHAIIVDDLIGTGQTLLQASRLLRKRGVLSIWAYATHALLSHQAEQCLGSDVLDKVVVTDSFSWAQRLASHCRAHVLPCAPLFAQALRQTATTSTEI